MIILYCKGFSKLILKFCHKTNFSNFLYPRSLYGMGRLNLKKLVNKEIGQGDMLP